MGRDLRPGDTVSRDKPLLTGPDYFLDSDHKALQRGGVQSGATTVYLSCHPLRHSDGLKSVEWSEFSWEW